MSQLETYEWSNIWYEHADDKSRQRVLIVGDSITVGYRGYVNELLNGEIYADAFSTSKSIDNAFYLDELKLVIAQSPKPYDLIHFNCGLHGFHLGADDYEKYYENVIEFIFRNYPDTKIALVLSTPITVDGSPSELDKIGNSIVCERNEKVLTFANRYKLPVNDLYTPMINKPQFREMDGYHYNQKGCRFQAELVAEFIQDRINQ